MRENKFGFCNDDHGENTVTVATARALSALLLILDLIPRLKAFLVEPSNLQTLINNCFFIVYEQKIA